MNAIKLRSLIKGVKFKMEHWKNRNNDHRSGGYGNRGGFGGQRRSFGPRQMHKATCANCGNECTVPFKPDGTRPVYCRDCYRAMKENGQLPAKKEAEDNKEEEMPEESDSEEDSEEEEDFEDDEE